MRFGICTDLRNASAAARAGFAYVEGALTAVAAADERAFGEMAAAVKGSGIACEALNVMLPGSIRLIGPDADLSLAEDYLRRGLVRAEALGVRVQAFGSGGARNVPDGWPRERATKQLTRFLRMAAGLAARHGIAVAIEPLNPGECNILNTVAEALALARRVDLPNVGVLADWYHMAQQGEGTGGLLEAGPALLHCHIANPAGRHFPLPGDGADYSPFFTAIGRAGYGDRVSVEGSGGPEDYAFALRRLEEYV